MSHERNMWKCSEHKHETCKHFGTDMRKNPCHACRLVKKYDINTRCYWEPIIENNINYNTKINLTEIQYDVEKYKELYDKYLDYAELGDPIPNVPIPEYIKTVTYLLELLTNLEVIKCLTLNQ